MKKFKNDKNSKLIEQQTKQEHKQRQTTKRSL